MWLFRRRDGSSSRGSAALEIEACFAPPRHEWSVGLSPPTSTGPRLDYANVNNSVTRSTGTPSTLTRWSSPEHRTSTLRRGRDDDVHSCSPVIPTTSTPPPPWPVSVPVSRLARASYGPCRTPDAVTNTHGPPKHSTSDHGDDDESDDDACYRPPRFSVEAHRFESPLVDVKAPRPVRQPIPLWSAGTATDDATLGGPIPCMAAKGMFHSPSTDTWYAVRSVGSPTSAPTSPSIGVLPASALLQHRKDVVTSPAHTPSISLVTLPRTSAETVDQHFSSAKTHHTDRAAMITPATSPSSDQDATAQRTPTTITVDTFSSFTGHYKRNCELAALPLCGQSQEDVESMLARHARCPGTFVLREAAGTVALSVWDGTATLHFGLHSGARPLATGEFTSHHFIAFFRGHRTSPSFPVQLRCAIVG
eukprot:m.206389 g.206389  ORF g.206389 m.206389 type:complete len:420 (+) comp23356_c0_seq1:275-1534(+)